jgi:5-methylthioribose kinase
MKKMLIAQFNKKSDISTQKVSVYVNENGEIIIDDDRNVYGRSQVDMGMTTQHLYHFLKNMHEKQESDNEKDETP